MLGLTRKTLDFWTFSSHDLRSLSFSFIHSLPSNLQYNIPPPSISYTPYSLYRQRPLLFKTVVVVMTTPKRVSRQEDKGVGIPPIFALIDPTQLPT